MQCYLIFHELAKIIRCVTGHQFAVGQNQHIITDCTDFRQNMGTQNDGMFLAKASDQSAHLNDLRRIQADCRLIQNNHLRISKQCLGQTYTLFVTFGQIPDQTV